MSWESNELPESEPRDWMKYVWFGILASVVLMIVLIAVAGKPGNVKSVAKAKHILIKFDQSDPSDRARAQALSLELRKRIQNGADFAALAREYSGDEVSAKRGGDLGWVERGILVAPVDDFIWTGPLSEVSEPILSRYGYHLVYVSERKVTEADAYEFGLRQRALKGTPGAAERRPAESTATP